MTMLSTAWRFPSHRKSLPQSERTFYKILRNLTAAVGNLVKTPLRIILSILRGVSFGEALYLEMAYQFFQIIREARQRGSGGVNFLHRGKLFFCSR